MNGAILLVCLVLSCHDAPGPQPSPVAPGPSIGGDSAASVDSGDPEVHPGAAEVCDNGVDDDGDSAAIGCSWPADLTQEDAVSARSGTMKYEQAGSWLRGVGDTDGDGKGEWAAMAWTICG